MASLGNPRTWVPYMNNKDCSQGFCSLYCPQWCYIVYPPPPPTFQFPQDDNDSTPNFSPLIIAIIGILVSAFLLVSYYTFISKYCGNTQSSPTQDHNPDDEIQDNHNPSLHEPWHVSTNGLDEALIKSIAVYKYKKADGLVGVTDCSVCLSEFQEDESLRLLPKCSHAFHLPCIDQWFKSHSNCPLCRAHIFTLNASAIQLPPPALEQEALSAEIHNNTSEENVVQGVERREDGMSGAVEEGAKPALRAFSDLGFMQGRHRMIEIRYEDDDEGIRRSVSMDHSFQIGQAEECSNEAGPSKRCGGESSKSSYRRKVLNCVLSPMAMKRSFSSGRFSISRNGRGRQGIIPV